MKFFNRYKFLLLIVLIGIGYLLFVNNSTIGWKSYTSDPYKIKFKAPSSLLVNLPKDRAPYYNIDIRDTSSENEVPAYMTIQYYSGSSKGSREKAVGQVMIGNKIVDRYDVSYPPELPYKVYQFEFKLKQDESFHFQQAFPKEKEKFLKIFDRVLSTIEFF